MPDTADPADEPMTASLTLPGRACQVHVARQWLAGLVAGSPAADDIVLVASELAANAVSHSRSGEPDGRFTMRAVIGSEFVRIEVTDAGGPWRTGPACDGSSGGDRAGPALVRPDLVRPDLVRPDPGSGDVGRPGSCAGKSSARDLRLGSVGRAGRGTGGRHVLGRGAGDRAFEGCGVDQFGRGLVIVASLSSAWGVDGDDAGRTAWCALPHRLP